VPTHPSHHVSSVAFRISCLSGISSLGFRIPPPIYAKQTQFALRRTCGRPKNVEAKWKSRREFTRRRRARGGLKRTGKSIDRNSTIAGSLEFSCLGELSSPCENFLSSSYNPPATHSHYIPATLSSSHKMLGWQRQNKRACVSRNVATPFFFAKKLFLC